MNGHLFEFDHHHHLGQSHSPKKIIDQRSISYPLKVPYLVIVTTHFLLDSDKIMLESSGRSPRPATGCPLGQRFEAIPDQRPELLGEARPPEAVRDQTWSPMV